MTTVAEIADFLESFAPSELAEDWDNVGLLVGDRSQPVERAMTCLTITPASAAEAIAKQTQLIVTHHPLPFRPLKRLTTDTVEGKLLWALIRAGVSIYSPHTAFDSALTGINQRLAIGLRLTEIDPIVPRRVADDSPAAEIGAGRLGRLDAPLPLTAVVERVKTLLGLEHLQFVGSPELQVNKIGVACGSAGEFIEPARRAGCECLVTGETRFHTALDAEAHGVGLILAGHYATERFAVEELAGVLAQRFPGLDCWASRDERDPLRWA